MNTDNLNQSTKTDINSSHKVLSIIYSLVHNHQLVYGYGGMGYTAGIGLINLVCCYVAVFNGSIEIISVIFHAQCDQIFMQIRAFPAVSSQAT